ncbi:MAG: hypothetical protein FJ100_20090 [Deltaproteobacteria bacterium]|nr:hypothetical protein [Deltaproteobacteria bacterium]
MQRPPAHKLDVRPRPAGLARLLLRAAWPVVFALGCSPQQPTAAPEGTDDGDATDGPAEATDPPDLSTSGEALPAKDAESPPGPAPVLDVSDSKDLGDDQPDGARGQPDTPAAKPDGAGSPCPDCDDDNACTLDVCRPWGVCEWFAKQCFDSNPCTVDSCDPAVGCVAKQVSCDDGKFCTNDLCYPWMGCYHTNKFCNDGNPCTLDACKPSGCTAVPAFEGHVCTGAALGTCAKGACAPFNGSLCAGLLGPVGLPTIGVGSTVVGLLAWPDGSLAVATLDAGQATVRWLGLDGTVKTSATVGTEKYEVVAVAAAGNGAAWLLGMHPQGATTQLWRVGAPGSAFASAKSVLLPSVASPKLAGMKDGGAVVAGTNATPPQGAQALRLLRVSAEGAVQWDTTMAAPQPEGTVDWQVAACGNGRVVAFARGAKQTGPMSILALSPTGALLWQTLLPPGDAGFLRLACDAAGAVAFAHLNRIGWLAADGGLVATKTTPGYPNAVYYAASQVTGVLWVPMPTAAEIAPTLQRYDDAGNLTSAVALPGAPGNLGPIAQMPDGRLAVLGMVGTSTELQRWIAIATPWGHIGCAAAGACAPVSACDDGKPCTADSCEPATGCVAAPLPKTATCT